MPDDYDYSQPVKRNPLITASVPLITMTLITFSAIFTAAYWIAPHDDTVNPLSNLVRVLLPTPSQIWDHHYLGLLTSFFIHLDVLHLVFNMLWLWKLGGTMESTIPPWKYLLFIVAGTVVGSCSELLISGQTGAGASGAAYALMGVLWAGRGFHDSWRQVATRENMQLFLGWGVLCIFLTMTHTLNVANAAHFGGLLFGLAVGGLFFAPRRRPAWIPVLVLMVGVCVVSLTWMPWSSSWNWYKGSTAFDRHHYHDAISFYERGLRTGGQQGPLLYNIALSRYFLTTDALDSDTKMDDRFLKTLDDQFNSAFAAAKAAAPPPSDANATTGDPQMNHLEKLKAELDQVFSPSDSKKGP